MTEYGTSSIEFTKIDFYLSPLKKMFFAYCTNTNNMGYHNIITSRLPQYLLGVA